jgi:hypothetical protein
MARQPILDDQDLKVLHPAGIRLRQCPAVRLQSESGHPITLELLHEPLLNAEQRLGVVNDHLATVRDGTQGAAGIRRCLWPAQTIIKQLVTVVNYYYFHTTTCDNVSFSSAAISNIYDIRYTPPLKRYDIATCFSHDSTTSSFLDHHLRCGGVLVCFFLI